MTREDFIQSVNNSHESLRKFLVTLCAGDCDLADDIAQETYMKAYISSKDFSNKEKFKPWIIKIAYNTFLNYLRSQKLNVDVTEIRNYETKDSPEDVFRYENLYQALDSLNPRDRSMVVLYYMEGYTMKEIADMLEIREDLVRKIISRARQKLKFLLD
ncbi:MAG: RNA polymerase sigma factor [Muribaculaceae bacterium]|nr:RNA polymerase sigma factor [Muribaculaceae bacterium]